MDLLGGLAKSMPRTFVLFVIGAVAICGLPPLNGFISEWFIYVGLFRTVTSAFAGSAWAALAAPALALVGALAVATFVKLLGIVFAGAPRSALGSHAHDPDLKMLLPMWIVATCCGLIGILPVLTIPILNRAITAWTPQMNHENIASYLPIGFISVDRGCGVVLTDSGQPRIARLRHVGLRLRAAQSANPIYRLILLAADRRFVLLGALAAP
jgi:hydrogenase-4 component B